MDSHHCTLSACSIITQRPARKWLLKYMICASAVSKAWHRARQYHTAAKLDMAPRLAADVTCCRLCFAFGTFVSALVTLACARLLCRCLLVCPCNIQSQNHSCMMSDIILNCASCCEHLCIHMLHHTCCAPCHIVYQHVAEQQCNDAVPARHALHSSSGLVAGATCCRCCFSPEPLISAC